MGPRKHVNPREATCFRGHGYGKGTVSEGRESMAPKLVLPIRHFHEPAPPAENVQDLQHSGRRPRVDVLLLPTTAPIDQGPDPPLVPRSPRPCPPPARFRPLGLRDHARTRP